MTTQKRKLTKNDISKLFFKFNRMYFENKLMIPSFGLLHTFRVLGQLQTRSSKRTGRVENVKLLITVNIEWTEDDLRDIIVHEMVHLAVWQKTGKNRNRHGGMFKDICNELERKYGIRVRKPDILTRDSKSMITIFRQWITRHFG